MDTEIMEIMDIYIFIYIYLYIYIFIYIMGICIYIMDI